MQCLCEDHPGFIRIERWTGRRFSAPLARSVKSRRLGVRYAPVERARVHACSLQPFQAFCVSLGPAPLTGKRVVVPPQWDSANGTRGKSAAGSTQFAIAEQFMKGNDWASRAVSPVLGSIDSVRPNG